LGFWYLGFVLVLVLGCWIFGKAKPAQLTSAGTRLRIDSNLAHLHSALSDTMPPRLLCLAVVAFWLATSSWLFYRELWPKMRPGEPPPYTIDLVDEARQHTTPILWTVYRGQKKIGKARSWVSYRDSDDTFELHGAMDRLELYRGPLGTVSVQKAANMYRINRDGELRELSADIVASVDVPIAPQAVSLKAHVDGQVQGRRFEPRGWVEWPGGRKDLQSEPVALSAYGAVLNPLQPVNRILDLRPGQRWRMPLVDPLGAAVNAAMPGFPSGPRVLDAVVLPEIQSLSWDGHDVPCLVIEYSGDSDVSARTWVRESDGLVLRQEARQGDLLILERDPLGH
jgi:hypothetical protein